MTKIDKDLLTKTFKNLKKYTVHHSFTISFDHTLFAVNMKEKSGKGKDCYSKFRSTTHSEKCSQLNGKKGFDKIKMGKQG